VDKPHTLATAIRIGNPASWKGARDAIDHSGGAVDIVTDEQILAAQRWLASNEGIFVEPASAASVAGLMRCLGKDRCETCPLPAIPQGGKIVLTVTGHGLKDPEAVGKSGAVEPMECEADSSAIRSLLQN
jgi:threonine synthase